jgi:hypothetical protein
MTELHLGYIDLRMLKPDALLVYELPLPVGYISVEDIGDVTVQFSPEGIDERTLTVSDIKIINIPEEYNISALSKSISNVTVYGPADSVDALTNKDLIAQINMLDVEIKEGQITVPVEILMPSNNNCWVYGDRYTARIDVSKIKKTDFISRLGMNRALSV